MTSNTPEYLKETPSQTAGPYVHIGLAPGAAGFDIYKQELGWDIAGPMPKASAFVSKAWLSMASALRSKTCCLRPGRPIARVSMRIRNVKATLKRGSVVGAVLSPTLKPVNGALIP